MSGRLTTTKKRDVQHQKALGLLFLCMYLFQLKSDKWNKTCKSGVLDYHIYELDLNTSELILQFPLVIRFLWHKQL